MRAAGQRRNEMPPSSRCALRNRKQVNKKLIDAVPQDHSGLHRMRGHTYDSGDDIAGTDLNGENSEVIIWSDRVDARSCFRNDDEELDELAILRSQTWPWLMRVLPLILTSVAVVIISTGLHLISLHTTDYGEISTE